MFQKLKYFILNYLTAIKTFFSVLWHSRLPCFDVKGITSNYLGEKSLLKYCEWRGKPVPCAAIFEPIPTDQGMCCSFNVLSMDKMVQRKAIPDCMSATMIEEKLLAFEDTTRPEWLHDDEHLKTFAGTDEALLFVLDGHSDLISGLSVNSDFQAFTGLIDPRGSFPRPKHRGFQIKPGHKNLVAMSAVKIDASDDIKYLDPSKRNCLFPDETQFLKIHKSYSQTNCFLECGLFDAREKLRAETNITCTPWFYPVADRSEEFCDPWNAVKFVEKLSLDKENRDCSYCLPDCTNTVYHSTVTTAPFRICENSNLGAAKFCNFDDDSFPEPKIWARQVIEEFLNVTAPDLVKNLSSSKRTYYRNPDIFPKLTKTYDAYDKDIAVVQVFFESPTVFHFNSELKQTWVSFLSTVGGLLGLCIGISLVSFIEIIWLILQISLALANSFLTPKK